MQYAWDESLLKGLKGFVRKNAKLRVMLLNILEYNTYYVMCSLVMSPWPHDFNVTLLSSSKLI